MLGRKGARTHQTSTLCARADSEPSSEGDAPPLCSDSDAKNASAPSADTATAVISPPSEPPTAARCTVHVPAALRRPSSAPVAPLDATPPLKGGPE